MHRVAILQFIIENKTFKSRIEIYDKNALSMYAKVLFLEQGRGRGYCESLDEFNLSSYS